MTRKPNAPQLRWIAFLDDLDTTWQDQAVCAKTGTSDDWFPETEREGREAAQACRTCPVKIQCLQYAMQVEVTQAGNPIAATSRFGIYGGLTPSERWRVATGKQHPRGERTHCANEHEYTAENTRIHPTGGHRVCRACEREYARRARRGVA